ncbi:hypothetical protein N7466_006948 [Penicillium verhagenii]|uniref:uncharacterized protein n=1 Tax=Penicillium verhagenii TaxID=1562060 RepID=UPI0025455191|nr:uncharacterized protein N7466_006948 [Penicillium verhagenii]KAJ5927992.1 hypothetical protein N7466_006948 [Penicillium verhagenii]
MRASRQNTRRGSFWPFILALCEGAMIWVSPLTRGAKLLSEVGLGKRGADDDESPGAAKNPKGRAGSAGDVVVSVLL